MTLGKNVNLFQIERDTHGYVGTDLSQLCLEAALQCIRTHVVDMDVDSEDPITEEYLDRLVVGFNISFVCLFVCWFICYFSLLDYNFERLWLTNL